VWDRHSLRQAQGRLCPSPLTLHLKLMDPPQQLGKTEIEDLDEAVLRDHDVFRFQIAVHDPSCVCLGQPVRDLSSDL
jgi:hypothetical protein